MNANRRILIERGRIARPLVAEAARAEAARAGVGMDGGLALSVQFAIAGPVLAGLGGALIVLLAGVLGVVAFVSAVPLVIGLCMTFAGAGDLLLAPVLLALGRGPSLGGLSRALLSDIEQYFARST